MARARLKHAFTNLGHANFLSITKVALLVGNEPTHIYKVFIFCNILALYIYAIINKIVTFKLVSFCENKKKSNTC